ncbi:response regulator [Chitinophaga sedimenti]|uniref:response regulator n=1 Tax=Chitinophaga sedimenti TaxID=2033606 RepID=UPI0020056869|nr:response regulator [Chitinophaga sedimenti]MCK7559525.1 response regulator [Chitinophaga sedimenti]
MSQQQIRILYIDDEVHNLNAFKASFRRLYAIHTAESAEEAYKLLEENDFHIIISDQRMPKMTGIEFLNPFSKNTPNPFVFC